MIKNKNNKLSKKKWNLIINKMNKYNNESIFIKKINKCKNTTSYNEPSKNSTDCDLNNLLVVQKENNESYDNFKILVENLIFVFKSIRTEFLSFFDKLNELNQTIQQTSITSEFVENTQQLHSQIVQNLYYNITHYTNMYIIKDTIKQKIMFDALPDSNEHKLIFNYKSSNGVIVNKNLCIISNISNVIDDTYNFIIGTQFINLIMLPTEEIINDFTTYLHNLHTQIISIINNINNNIKILESGLQSAKNLIDELNYDKC